MLYSPGKLAVRLTLELSTLGLLANSAPLLEEKWDTGVFTLLLNRKNPIFLHRPCAGSAFAAHYDPGDSIQRQLSKVFNQRFD